MGVYAKTCGNKKLFIKVENKFRTAKLLQKQDYYDVEKWVIKALLDSKELTHTAFEKFLIRLMKQMKSWSLMFLLIILKKIL